MSIRTLQQKFSLSQKQLLLLESEIEKRKPSKVISYILWFIGGFGIFGFHRFYNHDYKYGCLMLCTFGGLFFWGFTDIFRIDKICQKRTEILENEIIDEIKIIEELKRQNINVHNIL